jgi:hypothetical protein
MGQETITARQVRFVSVVLPCLNEAGAVGETVRESLRGLAQAGLDGEVLVVDNGSTDGSAELAAEAGARVIHESNRGYGAAHRAGIDAARGDAIVMADADATYDLENLGELVELLAHGNDLVIGSRLKGSVQPGAMRALHRYVGTPLITRTLFATANVRVSDSQSGFRAFWRDRALDLNLRTCGMEYASEMLLRAGHAGWRIAEVPSNYRPRVGVSKLNTFEDGWRHFKLLVVMSPHFSLMLPGLAALLLGLMLSFVSLVAPAGVPVGSARWLPVFVGPMFLVSGAQMLLIGAIAAHRGDAVPPRIKKAVSFLGGSQAIERLLVRFALVIVLGAAIDAVLVVLWLGGHSGSSLLGVAGLAQALLLIGVNGIATMLAADLARDSLWS